MWILNLKHRITYFFVHFKAFLYKKKNLIQNSLSVQKQKQYMVKNFKEHFKEKKIAINLLPERKSLLPTYICLSRLTLSSRTLCNNE